MRRRAQSFIFTLLTVVAPPLAEQARAAVSLTNVAVSGCGAAGVRLNDGTADVSASVLDANATGVILEPTAIVTMDGVQVTASAGNGIEARGQLSASNSQISGSGGDGILIDSADGVTLTNLQVHRNAMAGVRVLRADNAGLFFGGVSSQVYDNGGDGVMLGDEISQTGKVVALFDLGEIWGNTVGVRAQQKNETTHSTTTTMHGVIIHDNRSSGVYLKSSFLKRRVVGQTIYTRVTSNRIFHNAMAIGCSAPQSAPQVMVDGPVSVTPEEAQSCSTNIEADCRTAGAAGNPCYWTGFSCVTVWDLRGALNCNDITANPNQIHSYNTNTDPIGSSELSVGMYARNGANVWADNNSWRTGVEAQNVDQDASSFIVAGTICPAGGIILQCSSQ